MRRAQWAAVWMLVSLASACATPRAAQTSIPLREDHVEPELVSVRHKVEPGQTLYRIALSYEIEVDELMAANGISDPRALSVGQELLIPGVEEVRKVLPPPNVEPHGTASNSSNTSNSSSGSADKGKSTGRAKKVVSRPRMGPTPNAVLSWPLRGVLYGRFGKKGKEPHDGIDLAAPLGTPVKTAAPGLVLYAGEQKGYGNIVIIEHESGLVTLYAHNRDLRVKTGQKVRKEQVVATVGESGRTSGPHLHFEVRQEGLPVDPLPFLGQVPSR